MRVAVSFQHLRNTQNTGDAACSPYDRWDWGIDPRLMVRVGDLRQPSADYDIGIFGGGKIMRELAQAPGLRRGRLNIGWGLSTVQRNPLSLSYFKAKRALSLIGSRDWDGRAGYGGVDWAPCTSSQHGFFDNPPAPITDVVVYLHRGKSAAMGFVPPSDVPQRTNYDGSFEEALRFLAMGETVVSNSYHGVFWALILGRKVLCLPFSNKFDHYRLPPGYGSPRTWARDLSKARAQPELLGLCRQATAQFRAKVWEKIEGKLAEAAGTVQVP